MLKYFNISVFGCSRTSLSRHHSRILRRQAFPFTHRFCYRFFFRRQYRRKPFTACQRLLVFAVAVLFLVSAGCPIAAQTAGAGNIVGTVTDSSGATVPNATVVITNTDTGAIRTLTTNSTGSYTANFLQSGHYEVVLGGGSFGKIDRKNLALTVGETLTVDAALTPAS